MRKNIFFALVVIFGFAIFFACNQKGNGAIEETILKGSVTVMVDESILPVIEDQVQVFESKYDAKITLIPKSETEIVQQMATGKVDLAILTRELTKSEASFFEKKQINARVTPLATDAIALISHKNNRDTLVDVQNVIKFVREEGNTSFKGLVFDNANSSTVRYIKELTNVSNLPKDKVFSFKTNNEVIKFVSENPGMIGVVGVNWLYEPTGNMVETVKKVKVLAVKEDSMSKSSYEKPDQDHMASGLYPLTRTIKMLNYQGKSGLGMGFASFVAGEVGQRIILKSGLVPVRVPSRIITIRKQIMNDK